MNESGTHKIDWTRGYCRENGDTSVTMIIRENINNTHLTVSLRLIDKEQLAVESFDYQTSEGSIFATGTLAKLHELSGFSSMTGK